ncbi:hypothetical protein CO087_00035 [Candidatus Wolfebacteria bacterium CG_4_9_14_0_8_um_filter_39_46]|uniref:Uncharacterized protein n=2 Tax=Candidatus Wolfeibacteriota TaxID=1752735 RepID=A0A2M7Q7V2_9BACT|nr:MAG: hypothetical protein COY97_00955 [Candidatus Wolfebacteria bacterium CG_4_10_14_0_8_um_filter_39_64]PJB84235.1 MAG: hypothetical protein CO087_00035 [Candidatus Wolfebacteria bacterium CG_4_9_14_0_8_um_filter_39_46]
MGKRRGVNKFFRKHVFAICIFSAKGRSASGGKFGKRYGPFLFKKVDGRVFGDTENPSFESIS